MGESERKSGNGSGGQKAEQTLHCWLWRWRHRSCKPGDAGSLQKLAKSGTGSPPEPPRRAQPCQRLDFSPVRPPPQTCERISLCCFKPLMVLCYSSRRKLIQFQKLRLAFIPATSTLFHPSLIIFKLYLWHILPSLRTIIIHIYVYLHIYVINYINT